MIESNILHQSIWRGVYPEQIETSHTETNYFLYDTHDMFHRINCFCLSQLRII